MRHVLAHRRDRVSPRRSGPAPDFKPRIEPAVVNCHRFSPSRSAPELRRRARSRLSQNPRARSTRRFGRPRGRPGDKETGRPGDAETSRRLQNRDRQGAGEPDQPNQAPRLLTLAALKLRMSRYVPAAAPGRNMLAPGIARGLEVTFRYRSPAGAGLGFAAIARPPLSFDYTAAGRAPERIRAGPPLMRHSTAALRDSMGRRPIAFS